MTVQRELVNGLVGEEEIAYPLKESEVSEHRNEIMQLFGAWLQHIMEDELHG